MNVATMDCSFDLYDGIEAEFLVCVDDQTNLDYICSGGVGYSIF